MRKPKLFREIESIKYRQDERLDMKRGETIVFALAPITLVMVFLEVMEVTGFINIDATTKYQAVRFAFGCYPYFYCGINLARGCIYNQLLDKAMILVCIVGGGMGLSNLFIRYLIAMPDRPVGWSVPGLLSFPFFIWLIYRAMLFFWLRSQRSASQTDDEV